MKRSLCCLAALVVLSACGPAENNENSASNNTTSNNTTANNTTSNNTANNTTSNNTANNTTSNNTANNTNMMAGGVSFSDDIVPIIASNCAVAGCHAGGGNGNFAIGDTADAANIAAALDGIDSTAGTPLIDPTNPENSEIYIRVSGMARTQMPLGGMLMMGEITAIEAWITEGANLEN